MAYKMMNSLIRKVKLQSGGRTQIDLYRSFSNHSPLPLEYDVTIIGGGASGSILASLIAQNIPSLNICLLDTRKPRSLTDIYVERPDAKTIPALPSPRAYALSPKSLSMIPENVLHDLVDAGRIAFYDSMQVWESDGPSVLHFTQEDVFHHGKHPDGSITSLAHNTLGAVVEDEPLVSSLWDHLAKNTGVHLMPSVSITDIDVPKQDQQEKDRVQLSLNDAPSISTNLLVAADGGNSFVRNTIGRFPIVKYAYGRQAVTCTVEIDTSIQQTAFQRFQPNGPIALLPIWDENVACRRGHCEDKMYANIVWSTTPGEAQELEELTDDDFVARMNDLLQSGPAIPPSLVPDHIKESMPKPLAAVFSGLDSLVQGANIGLSVSGATERRRGFVVPPMITKVAGKRFAFDLNLMHAKNYVNNRVALLGDAAHTVHPMAGQGLNLGLGDAECLTRNLKNAVESGMGIKGSTGLEYALQQYESERQREVLATMGGIQFLHAAFGTTFSPAVNIRSLGMNMINSIGPVRQKLASIATGVYHE
jgi:ubiquinone biosynthesis monooxygenase Coq6